MYNSAQNNWPGYFKSSIPKKRKCVLKGGEYWGELCSKLKEIMGHWGGSVG